MKLGRLPVKFNERTLSFSQLLLKDAVFPEPAKLYREYKIPDSDWGMYGNDIAGDCTCAAKAHRMMLMTAHTGKMFVPDPQDIMKAYVALTGYDPLTGANDTGCAMTDVFQYEQTTGIADHKILAWAQVDHTNIDRIKQAMYVFGCVDIGVDMPSVAMDQFDLGQAWDVVTNDGGIDGGHDVPLFGYGSVGDSCVTWAKRHPLTWNWFLKYCREAYIVITKDWLDNATGLAPNTMDMDKLVTALKQFQL